MSGRKESDSREKSHRYSEKQGRKVGGSEGDVAVSIRCPSCVAANTRSVQFSEGATVVAF
jgi:hypothetical protein